jgi:arsenate reductase-like glutaredoxin family protein
VSCARTQEFLAKRKIETKEQQDAKKQTIDGRGALDLLRQVDEIYAAKGSKLVHIDLRVEKPDSETLRGLIIGPTGNLRAPTLRVGRTLLVGFSEEAYRKVLA